MGTPDLFPVLDVDDERPRAHHVFHARSRLVERGLDIAQNLQRLHIRVADSNNLSVRTGRGRAGYMHVRSNPNSSGVTNYRLPRSTTGDIRALHRRREVLLLPIILLQLA